MFKLLHFHLHSKYSIIHYNCQARIRGFSGFFELFLLRFFIEVEPRYFYTLFLTKKKRAESFDPALCLSH